MESSACLILVSALLLLSPHAGAQSSSKDNEGWKSVLGRRAELRDFPESQISLEKGGIVHVRAGNGIMIPQKTDNGSIRARVHFMAGHKDVQIRTRRTDAGYYNLISYGSPDPVTEFALDASKNGAGKRLGVAKFPEPVPVGGTVDVELSTFGDHIQVLINGKLALDVHDSTFPKGKVWGVASGQAWFSNIEVRSLTADPSPPPEVAQAKSAKPAAAAPADPRLAQMQASYETAREREVTARFQQSVKELDAKYIAALDRAMESATKAGNLDMALAFRGEKQRVTSAKPLPSDDPEDLKPLRANYRAAFSQMEAQRKQHEKPLREKYIKELEAYQTELTRAGNLDGVLAVRALKESEMALNK